MLQAEKDALKEATKAQLRRIQEMKEYEKRPTPLEQQHFEDVVGPDNFNAHQLLGTGSFGEVFLVERKTDK